MRIIIAMQCHDGTLDGRAEFQQRAVSAPLHRSRPHTLKDIPLWAYRMSDLGDAHDGIIRIGHESQDAQTSQKASLSAAAGSRKALLMACHSVWSCALSRC